MSQMPQFDGARMLLDRIEGIAKLQGDIQKEVADLRTLVSTHIAECNAREKDVMDEIAALNKQHADFVTTIKRVGWFLLALAGTGHWDTAVAILGDVAKTGVSP